MLNKLSDLGPNSLENRMLVGSEWERPVYKDDYYDDEEEVYFEDDDLDEF